MSVSVRFKKVQFPLLSSLTHHDSVPIILYVVKLISNTTLKSTNTFSDMASPSSRPTSVAAATVNEPELPQDEDDVESENEREVWLREGRGAQAEAPKDHEVARYRLESPQLLSIDQLVIDRDRKHGQIRTLSVSTLKDRIQSLISNIPSQPLRATVWASNGIPLNILFIVHPDTFYVLGGQHSCQAVKLIIASKKRKKEGVPKVCCPHRNRIADL